MVSPHHWKKQGRKRSPLQIFLPVLLLIVVVEWYAITKFEVGGSLNVAVDKPGQRISELERQLQRSLNLIDSQQKSLNLLKAQVDQLATPNENSNLERYHWPPLYTSQLQSAEVLPDEQHLCNQHLLNLRTFREIERYGN